MRIDKQISRKAEKFNCIKKITVSEPIYVAAYPSFAD